MAVPIKQANSNTTLVKVKLEKFSTAGPVGA